MSFEADSKGNMLNNLQVLRAFAALNVVYVHVIATAANYRQSVSLFSFLGDWGVSGVDIFFVISGFVMVYTQSKNPRSAFVFFKNRVFRIVPIYWLLTALLLSLYILLPSAFKHLNPTLADSLSSFFFVTRIFSGGEPPLIFVGWTLEYEMLFYALFSLGLVARDRRIAFATPILILISLTIFGFAKLIVLEFVFGMACAKFYLENRGSSFGWAAFVFGVLLFILTIYFRLEMDRAWLYGIPAFLVVFGLVNIPQTNNRLLVYLGDASYSIYLVQVFSIAAFYKFSSKFLTFLPNDVLSVFALISSAAFGCFVYQYLEMPIGRFLKRNGWQLAYTRFR